MKHCKRCAKPLRTKPVVRHNSVIFLAVCKSPICELYGRPQ